jgi:hypothetical protein
VRAGVNGEAVYTLGADSERWSTAMDNLKDWLKYWRKVISKCSKIHKDSKLHKKAYAELSSYLDSVEDSARDGELDATVLWAVKFMQRMHELEKEIGLHVVEKKIHSAHGEIG